MSVDFCDPFDESLARNGPAAVFLPDPEGLLRFDAEWSRDAWARSPGPHPLGWTWLLLRDRDSGFVQLVLCTSPTLITDHPRADVRAFPTLGEAREARQSFGHPPVTGEPW